LKTFQDDVSKVISNSRTIKTVFFFKEVTEKVCRDLAFGFENRQEISQIINAVKLFTVFLVWLEEINGKIT
jgi:hypothetical protein